jgi:RNA polymerase sigma factor (sigma-70 family)
MKCRFEEFLVNYQPDLRRIVGKHLSKYLHIGVGDVVSTVNYQLIKTKQKFFDHLGYDFSKADFTKWAYIYARNLTKWQALRYKDKDSKLQDGSYYTEDGEKSLFDIVCDEYGEDNEELEEFDSDAKITVIENIINKYSHILAPREKIVFSGLLHGKSELELSKEGGVTRQAINVSKIKVFGKIRAHYNFTVEDIHKVSPQQMEESIEVVLGIYNRYEERRLRIDRQPKGSPNPNLFEYVTE